MRHLRDVIAAAIADLNAVGQPFALIGGLAVSARAEPRTTRDVDLAVAVSSDEQAESVIVALLQRNYHLLQTIEQTGTLRLATARLRPPQSAGGGALVDLLFASSGIEPEIVAAATHLEILAGITVAVAQAGHLIALKLLSRDRDARPQDSMDLNALFREATPSDIESAREAIDLIEARGFNRARDLHAALADALANHRLDR